MPKHIDQTVSKDVVTQLTANDVSTITLQNNTGRAVSLFFTADATPPDPATSVGRLVVPPAAGLLSLALADFAGVPGAARVWVLAPVSGVIFVSHA